MYFFYIDESGTRDTQPRITKRNGQQTSDHLYVLTAVSLFERRWTPFDLELSDQKLQLMKKLWREKSIRIETLADCEVKSTALRTQKKLGDKGYSGFIHNLSLDDKTALAQLYYSQLEKHQIRIFSVVIDKRKLRSHMTPDTMHKKAYELLLERIQQFLHEYHHKHYGIIVMDDTQTQQNQSIAMKHAFFQRSGNGNLRFHNIIEYPFFPDSRLSNGVQLADLCCYNVNRAFRSEDFSYPFFKALLPYFYRSRKTSEGKLDGLKVFPNDSELINFANLGCRNFLEETNEGMP